MNPSPSPNEPRTRKIVHVDMDAFYASVEQRDEPSLRGRPLAVGGSDARGVVAAASYEARAYGVRSAMPKFKARELCPDLVFVPPRFEVYKAVSAQIRTIFAEHTALIEPLSLDEAYLDVTENLKGIPFAWQAAKEIRAHIFEETGLTASAGVSYNKFLAKMASSQRKPDGQFAITPEQGPDFVASLPIGKFHGIGPATEQRMLSLGIANGADLRDKPLLFLQRHFGKSGPYYFNLARGIDERPVNPERIRKSIGAENTFATDVKGPQGLLEHLTPLVEKVWAGCETHGTRGKTVTIKVTYSDFNQITRSKTLAEPIHHQGEIKAAATDLILALAPNPLGIRLLGITLSSLDTNPDAAECKGQMSLTL